MEGFYSLSVHDKELISAVIKCYPEPTWDALEDIVKNFETQTFKPIDKSLNQIHIDAAKRAGVTPKYRLPS